VFGHPRSSTPHAPAPRPPRAPSRADGVRPRTNSITGYRQSHRHPQRHGDLHPANWPARPQLRSSETVEDRWRPVAGDVVGAAGVAAVAGVVSGARSEPIPLFPPPLGPRLSRPAGRAIYESRPRRATFTPSGPRIRGARATERLDRAPPPPVPPQHPRPPPAGRGGPKVVAVKSGGAGKQSGGKAGGRGRGRGGGGGRGGRGPRGPAPTEDHMDAEVRPPPSRARRPRDPRVPPPPCATGPTSAS